MRQLVTRIDRNSVDRLWCGRHIMIRTEKSYGVEGHCRIILKIISYR